MAYGRAGATVLRIKGYKTNTPPGSPDEGDCYLIGASPTGAWSSHAGKLAFYFAGAWAYQLAAKSGGFILVDTISSPSKIYFHDDSAPTEIVKLTNMSIFSTKGELISFDGTNTAKIAVGGNGQVPTWDSTNANGIVAKDPAIQIGLSTQTTTAIAAGSGVYGIAGSSSLAARFVVPTGKSLKILCASGCFDTGTGTGTWTGKLVVRANGSTVTVLATQTGGTASTIYAISATGTLASPLATLSAGDLLQVGWENDATSPGAFGTNNKSCFVFGVLV